jgi:hypothetical protein
MILSKEYKTIIEQFVNEREIIDKIYGIKAMTKIKQLFFPNNKKEANKWQNRWTDDEIKNSIYFTYFVKNNKHANFIIGEDNRLSVLGQRNINKIKTLRKKTNRKGMNNNKKKTNIRSTV